MTKFERLFKLYKVSFHSEINDDKYYVVVRFSNGLRFEAKHEITRRLKLSAAVKNITIEKHLNDYYHELSFMQAKKNEADEFVKTLPGYQSKLLSRYFKRYIC